MNYEMDYEIEFQRLLGYAEQALAGVNINKREVLAFAGLAVLNDVVKDYKNRLTPDTFKPCSYSPDDGKMIVSNLPVTEENVRLVLNSPSVTYDDLDSLYFSVTNCEALGGWTSPLLDKINCRYDDLLREEGKLNG